MVKGKNGWGTPANGINPTFDDDLVSYVNYAVNYDEAAMEARYGKYPLVMEKYHLFKAAMTKIGYVF